MKLTLLIDVDYTREVIPILIQRLKKQEGKLIPDGNINIEEEIEAVLEGLVTLMNVAEQQNIMDKEESYEMAMSRLADGVYDNSKIPIVSSNMDILPDIMKTDENEHDQGLLGDIDKQ
jgi:hypothetical protein